MRETTDKSEKPDEPLRFLGPGYDFAVFRRDVSSGQLRWLASLCLLLNLGILIWLATGNVEPVIHYPIHVTGLAVYWVLGGSLFAWSLLAIVNWRTAWRSRRKRMKNDGTKGTG
jgi:hypothetical protein